MKNYCIPALLSILLSGCGGGSSSNSVDTIDTILTGVFVDSAVEGVSYSTSTQSGTTNSAGEFSYLNGEQVTFSIGATLLPSVNGAPQVSPVEMAEGSSSPPNTTTNIARLLQSLDVDGNPDNGITISSEAEANAALINFDVTTEQFENDTAVINMVANSGSVNSALISPDVANQHLNETLGISVEAGPPAYRNQIRDPGEGESFITDNVITLISAVSDDSRQRNRLFVETQDRLIADLALQSGTSAEIGRVLARVNLTPYNDTVDPNVSTQESSVGNIAIFVDLDLTPGGELAFSACANRDTGNDQEELFILNGETCIFDSTPVQIGDLLRMGVEFDRDTGELAIIINDSTFEFQLAGPFFSPFEPFNVVEVTARDGQSRIVTDIFGIGSDNFDDDFSEGVLVEGINQ